MDSSQMILWMIIGCTCLIGVLIFSKPFKFLIKFLLRSLFGILAIFIANIVLTPLGISVGLNALSIFIIGMLGAPGFICLCVVSKIL